MPATYGSLTPSVDATATAASAAVPPWRRTASPALVAGRFSDATAPPEPTAVGCFCSGLATPDAGGVTAASPAATAMEQSRRCRRITPGRLPVRTEVYASGFRGVPPDETPAGTSHGSSTSAQTPIAVPKMPQHLVVE